jgi:hypothetical protein
MISVEKPFPHDHTGVGMPTQFRVGFHDFLDRSSCINFMLFLPACAQHRNFQEFLDQNFCINLVFSIPVCVQHWKFTSKMAEANGHPTGVASLTNGASANPWNGTPLSLKIIGTNQGKSCEHVIFDVL